MNASTDDEMTWDAWLWVAAIALLGAAAAVVAISGCAATLAWLIGRF